MAAVNNNSSSAHPSCSKPAATAPARGGASRYCLCAPTTHPGSFRCRLHRPRAVAAAKAAATAPSGSDQASMEAAAAEEEEKKEKEKEAAAAARALLARVAGKPRQQDVGRVKGFQPRPSRLRIWMGES